MSKVLRLSSSPLVFGTPPCETHDNGDDDGDLYGSDDGRYENVVEFLSTGNHVQDVEVLDLVTLLASVARITPACGDAILDFTLAVFTEVGVVLCAGGEDLSISSILPYVCRVKKISLAFATIVFVFFLPFFWTSPQMLHVNLHLLQARCLSYVTGGSVGVSVCSTHRVVIMATAVNVAHAQDILRVHVAFCSKLAGATFCSLFPSACA